MEATIARDPVTAARPSAIPSTLSRWCGRALSALPIVFLSMDALMKLLRVAPAVEATAKIGLPLGAILPLGLIEAACVVGYLVPRTSVLATIVFTGYLGGAVATHVRAGDPLLTHVLAPVYVATMLWLGLWLRNPRLRAVLPLR